MHKSLQPAFTKATDSLETAWLRVYSNLSPPLILLIACCHNIQICRSYSFPRWMIFPHLTCLWLETASMWLEVFQNLGTSLSLRTTRSTLFHTGICSLHDVEDEIEMWRNQEAAMAQLTHASRKLPIDHSVNKQMLGLKSQMQQEVSKSKELSMLLETTADTSR